MLSAYSAVLTSLFVAAISMQKYCKLHDALITCLLAIEINTHTHNTFYCLLKTRTKKNILTGGQQTH
jgi:hypothetical protein